MTTAEQIALFRSQITDSDLLNLFEQILIDVRVQELQAAYNTVCFHEQSLEQKKYLETRIYQLIRQKNEC